MRTPLVLTVVLVAACMLSGCAGSRVGTISAARIYQESDAGKAGLAYLEQVEQDVKAKAEAAQLIAENMADNEAVALGVQKFFVDCQEAMNTAQQQAVITVQDLITRTITSVREQQKMAVIVQSDAVISADPAVDVTDLVITEMNKVPVTFEPVQLPDFVPPSK